MSETKFTPGPWFAVASTETDNFWSIKTPIGDIAYLTLEPNNLWGNAHLIAAAPELYEALEEFIEAYCRAGCDLTREERIEDRKRLIKARAALKKARGES